MHVPDEVNFGPVPAVAIVGAMPNYRCAFVPGGCWFFTVNLLERRNALRLLRPTAALGLLMQATTFFGGG